MNEILKKDRKNSVPLVITQEIKREIKQFKERLMDLYNSPTETSDFDVNTIDIVLNQLDDYDRNLLIAYYALADGNASILAKLFDTSQPIITRKISIIHRQIKKLNNVTKTPNNKPRCNPDC